MALNEVELNPGTGGAKAATDLDSGTSRHYQIIKLAHGAADTFTLASVANPFPVRLFDGTDGVLITASGELNVIATAQPGVDIGDVTINNAAGASAVNIQDGGNSITVDNGGTFLVQVSSALPAGTNNIGDVDILTVPAPLNVVGNGSAASAIRVTLANDSTGTVVVSGSLTTVSSITAVGTITNNVTVIGSTTHDSAWITAPVGIGARASSATPTAVNADGDMTRIWADRRGALKIVMVDDAGDSCMDGTLDSLKVAVTNTAAIPIKQSAATTALTNVAASATSVTLLASNSARLGATVYNDSTDTLTLKLGATASATSMTTKVRPEGYYEVPFGYTGVIDGLWSGTNGAARVTEITA